MQDRGVCREGEIEGPNDLREGEREVRRDEAGQRCDQRLKAVSVTEHEVGEASSNSQRAPYRWKTEERGMPRTSLYTRDAACGPENKRKRTTSTVPQSARATVKAYRSTRNVAARKRATESLRHTCAARSKGPIIVSKRRGGQSVPPKPSVRIRRKPACRPYTAPKTFDVPKHHMSRNRLPRSATKPS